MDDEKETEQPVTGCDLMQRSTLSQLTHINLARGFRGGERQTELLIRALARRGVPQRLVVRREQPLQTRLADVEQLQIVPIDKPFVARLKVFRGSFLHAHDGHGAHVAHWAHTFLGVPYMLTRRVDNRPSGSWATLRMYRRAAGIAVLSQAIERVLLDYAPELAVDCIPSASGDLSFSSAEAAALRSQWGGKYVVGQVGALDDSHKGQLDFIAAARQLLDQDDDWRFVIVGGGKDADRLRRAARGLEQRVLFTGYVDNVGDYLAAFDALAYPSIHEGLGSTLLDAMQARLPIVASAVDGIPEIVAHDKQGLLIPPRAPAALAAELQRVRGEPGLGARLAEAGSVRAGDYTPDAMADRYLAWYGSMGLDVAHSVTDDRTTAKSKPTAP